MILSVLDVHSPIASLFKCNISYLWRVARGPSASAELLVLVSVESLVVVLAGFVVLVFSTKPKRLAEKIVPNMNCLVCVECDP